MSCKILGIESSCDESSCAIYDSDLGLQSLSVYTHEVHAQWGGVVPELAAREHAVRLMPTLRDTLNQAQVDLSEVSFVAFTKGPGLPGALLAGAAFAQSIAWSCDIPAVGVHHLEGHILTPMMDQDVAMPFLTLLVSGGHSMFVLAKAIGQYDILGQSLDDAVGECFDKVAKMLGLGYPGGAALESSAARGDAHRFSLPRPMVKQRTLDMSFSGLKTAARVCWQRLDSPTAQDVCDMAASVQAAIIDTLCYKAAYLLECHKGMPFVLTGGVAANKALRTALEQLCHKKGVKIHIPSMRFCGDNAAMIAFCGSLRVDQQVLRTYDVKPRWSLQDLGSLKYG